MSEQTPPEQFESKVVPRLIEDEMRDSFIDYSMSVIVQRALPDVRDGLKPVHRRILYSMHEAGLSPNRPFKKSATVVGDVLGKYHPHGDASVYDALVRMVQDFSLRYPLISGQGNFGSIDGDGAAAYRYTEAKLAPIAGEMLADIDKETVDFSPNYDDRLLEPTVLPAKLPNLLVNGSSGIAVGMATNIPPHNLREVVDACVHLIDNPDATVEHLRAYVRGPDFPTGGFIYAREGIDEAYETGRGRIVVRAKADIEERDDGRERIVVTEIPFQVNKSRLIEQIAELVRDKKIEGISDLRDESDRDGMRIVIELRRDVIPYIVLNQLYKHTQMQATFGVIMLALVNGAPRVLSLKEMLFYFVDHRHTVVVRRTQFELGKAQEREHILEGLKIAVDNIDEVIQIIRGSDTTEEAGERLRERFALSERQSDAILNMRLAKLTGLEIEQLEAELAEVRATIAELQDILGSRERRYQIIKDELMEVADKYGDERRTEIMGETGEFSLEDLIADEEMVITVSHSGYIKRMPVDTYRKQGRGGRGITGMETKEEDWVENLFVARTHDYLMIFTRDGQCYWLKVHQIPVGSRNSRGKPVVNLINLDPGERIASLVPVREFSSDRYLMFATRKGTVKKTVLSAFGNPRVVGINAMNVLDGDELIDVHLTDGKSDVVLATREGMAIRFHETNVREMGRATTGVRGISLMGGDVVIGMVVVPRPEGEVTPPEFEVEGEGDVADSVVPETVLDPPAEPESESEDAVVLDPAQLGGPTLLVVTEKGMGKRTLITAYRLQRRAGKGVINVKTTDKTGKVVAIKPVTPGDELMIITRKGIVNRQSVDPIRVIGRNTQGVRLVNLDPKDVVMDVACLLDDEDIEEAVEEATGEAPLEATVEAAASTALEMDAVSEALDLGDEVDGEQD